MAVFTPFGGSGALSLVDALVAPGSGIVVQTGTVALNASALDAVNFYDGSLTALGIGAGLLLTSGTTPGLVNTVGWFGQDNSGTSGFANGDPSIDAVVNTVFQTQSYDATTLSFDFTVSDPTATSISFDVVFGSDEYPEWVDQFVDSAIVMVNGVNYALFNHDPAHPLSVISANVAAGYFQDNAGNTLPIEYDGVSHVLKIVAPIVGGGATNSIKIGIADTGDHIYDSGIFLANFTAGTIPGSGVVIGGPGTGTGSDDTLTGTVKDEYFDLLAGNDTCYAGAGDDIVVAGAGNDTVYGGSGNDQLKGDAGDDHLDGGDGVDTAVYSGASTGYVVTAVAGGFTITDLSGGPSFDGTDTLTGIEEVKFSDGLFALGTGGLTPLGSPYVPPANTPGTVVISGIAAAGQALTANVNDPDGIAGAISYQWQISSDGGATWSAVGTDSSTYTVQEGDIGGLIEVTASYVDNGAQAEAPISAAKSIPQTNNGDLVVTLMHLDAPAGASVIDPITTLVKDAMELGASPNEAVTGIRDVLGLAASVNPMTYDAYAALQANPSDAKALSVEKVAVQIAILTSLSDDDTGVNLALKLLEANAAGKTVDLANAQDLAGILGVDITGIVNPALYPQPLREIYDRNKSMSDALADGGDVSVIEAEWQDFLSIQDNVASTSIADLSIHVNQAPVGSATASLTAITQDTTATLYAADLLQGFSDPDGNPLSVSGLAADNASIVDNLDGTFSVTPTSGYSGPIELTYSVVDGLGGSTPASQLLVVSALAGVTIVGTAAADLIDATHTVGGQPLPTDHGDVITTDGGNDTVHAGAGNDVIDGGSGRDALYGNDGNDTFLIHNGDVVKGEVYAGGNGQDTVQLVNATSANLSTVTLTGIEGLLGSAGADVVTFALGQFMGLTSLDAGGGNDTVKATFAGTVDISAATAPSIVNLESLQILGSTGNDVLTLNEQQFLHIDRITLGLGNDRVDVVVGSGPAVTTGDWTGPGAFPLLSGVETLDLLGSGGSIDLTVAQYGQVSSIADGLSATLADTGQHLAALTVAQITALAGRGIDAIDAVDNVLSLGLDRFNALGIVQLAANDAVTVSGTTGNDVFTFAQHAFTSNDRVLGGAGTDKLVLDGDYSAGLAFGAASLSKVEQIGLVAGHDYALTMDDANVASGQSLALDASSLGALDSVVFDGAAETNGRFALTGGAGHSTFTGGSRGDAMVAGSGADSFRYTSAGQSTGTTYDTITGFDAGSDVFDLTDIAGFSGVTAVDSVTTGALNASAFTANLTAAMAGLAADHAALFTASSGTLAGATFLVVDLNGTTGYQSGSDLVVRLNGTTGSIGTGNFL